MKRLQIVKDGQSNYSIVVPENASIVEENASRELRDYFVKTANVKLRRTEEGSENGPCFYIGYTEFAKKNGIKGDSEENWQIAVCGENIVLTGGITNLNRGISYAAYHFIEDIMGVRWWNEVEEYIPDLQDFSVPADLRISGTPVFSERKVVSSFSNYDFTYLARNRINLISNGDNVVGRQFARTALETGGAHYVGLPAMCHTLELYYPAKEYFDEHPEWYGWNEAEGRRSPDFQLCFSSEGLFEDLLQRLLYNIKTEKRAAEHFRTEPPAYYSITLADHQRHCQCRECQESIKKSGLSGHNIKFTNRLAREVGKIHPDVYLETSAYWDFFDVPVDDTLPDLNVKIRIADMLVDVAHDIYYPTNRHKYKTMKKWGEINKKCGASLWHWDYMFHNTPNFPMASMFIIPTNTRAYHEMGIDSIFIENEIFALSDFWCCKQWLLCKFVENPYTDFEWALTDFLEKYYGKDAAPFIREYLDMVHEECENSMMRIRLAQNCSNHNYVSPKLLYNGIKLFEKAYKTADGNPIYIQRLREAEASIYKTIAIRRRDLDRIMELEGENYNLPTAKEAALWVIDYLNSMGSRFEYKYGVTSAHIDKFFTRGIAKELELFNGILSDVEIPFKMPDCLENVKEEDIYNLPVYQIIRYYEVVQNRVTRVKDEASDSGTVLRFKASELGFTENVRDVSKWNIPIVIESEGKPDRVLEITKNDLDGGGYRWFRIADVSDVGFGTMSRMYIKCPDDLIVQLSPLTDAFPFDNSDIYFRMRAEGESFGTGKGVEDAFYFDRFAIVRK